MEDNRIKEIRKAQGMTLEQLGAEVGHGKSYISMMEKGERPIKVSTLKRIAKALNCDPSDLIGDLKPASQITGRSKDSNTTQHRPATPPHTVTSEKIPVYGTVSGAQDKYAINSGDMPIAHIDAHPALAHFSNAFALRVDGESMLPKYRTGDYVYISPDFPLPGDDCVILFKNGEGIIKQYVGRTEDTIKLHQYNPNQDLELDASEVESILLVAGSLWRRG